MANIKINGNTYNGVTKLYAQKADGSGNQVFGTPDLQSKSVTANGTVTPDSGYDGLSQVTVNVPSTPTQTKSMTLGSAAPSTVTPDSGYALSSVSPSIDASVIKAENIAQGATILGIAGTHQGGGGGGSASKKDINFYDYDGTIVESWTLAELASKTALPANPSHDGLTAQGWNWSLADLKTQNTKMNVGQMYITSDGKTRIYIRLEEGRLAPCLGVCPNGTVDVDWGDGTAHSTLTGSDTTVVRYTSNHTYAAAGEYVIVLTVTGSMVFSGASLLIFTPFYDKSGWSGWDDRNRAYLNAIKKVHIGSSVTSIGLRAFYGCNSLSSMTIPDSVTSIGGVAFCNCYSLSSVTIPDSVTSIGNSAFSYCYSLSSMTIPDSVTSIGLNAFYYCYSLRSMTIPDSVTSIGSSAFYYCNSLSSMTIPDSVTSIGSSAFYYCSGLGFIKFEPSTPPTIGGSSCFTQVPTDCKILVPTGSLAAYTSATNYPSPNTYTYEEY